MFYCGFVLCYFCVLHCCVWVGIRQKLCGGLLFICLCLQSVYYFIGFAVLLFVVCLGISCCWIVFNVYFLHLFCFSGFGVVNLTLLLLLINGWVYVACLWGCVGFGLCVLNFFVNCLAGCWFILGLLFALFVD